ncbi:MAG: hypothetical protein PHQ34_00370 [Methanothrix sp.]|nr:hypothetical protein [Methanothrix sp.]
MNSIDNPGSAESSEKKAYEPPRAMRLGDMRNGAGLCESTGSGDASCIADGNSAGFCSGEGSGFV